MRRSNLPAFLTRKETRVARKASTKDATAPTSTARQYDANRPEKPLEDELYQELANALAQDKRSLWAKANVTGLSTATLTAWGAGTRPRKVKRPQAISLQMAARGLGGRIVFIRDQQD